MIVRIFDVFFFCVGVGLWLLALTVEGLPFGAAKDNVFEGEDVLAMLFYSKYLAISLVLLDVFAMVILQIRATSGDAIRYRAMFVVLQMFLFTLGLGKFVTLTGGI